MIVRSVSALALFAAASAANAAFISFASDTSPLNPTLIGTWNPGTMTNTVTDVNPTVVDLLFDVDEAGPIPPITRAAQMDMSLTLIYASSAPLGFGMFAHAFNVVGNFSFTNMPAADAFNVDATIALGEAVFVGLGSGSQVNSASITGADITYNQVVFSPAIIAFAGFNLPGDFGFTITALNGGAGAQLVTNGQGQVVGINNFFAESSFSGSFAVPTPGAAALAGLAGVTAIRRRRK